MFLDGDHRAHATTARLVRAMHTFGAGCKASTKWMQRPIKMTDDVPPASALEAEVGRGRGAFRPFSSVPLPNPA